MPDPGTMVLAALIAWCIGGICFLAAGITLLTHVLRNERQDRP